MAAGFHLAVARLIGVVAEQLRETTGIDRVALSGGVFQNRLVVRLARAELARRHLRVLTHGVVPPNDGGLALGQVAVAGAAGAAGAARLGRPSACRPQGAMMASVEPGWWSTEEAGPSEDLAAAALALARHFAAGATMWCVSVPWPAHGRHLAVEFVHPVIVGKRALPAVHLEAGDVVGSLRLLGRPGDVLVALSTADDAPPSSCCAGPRPGAWPGCGWAPAAPVRARRLAWPSTCCGWRVSTPDWPPDPVS